LIKKEYQFDHTPKGRQSLAAFFLFQSVVPLLAVSRCTRSQNIKFRFAAQSSHSPGEKLSGLEDR
jgi:hypothetical protein